ncbi:MAG: YkgJ family cysteine cluster protein [Firmicutes bacterium]|nr:YkgJ family cysteine cluster protein [Bacillota bacterium]
MECRPNCGACCIIPSITTRTKALPMGKPAMVACPHLDEQMLCLIFKSPDRPKVCASLKPSTEMCGQNREEAVAYLTWLEESTKP